MAVNKALEDSGKLIPSQTVVLSQKGKSLKEGRNAFFFFIFFYAIILRDNFR